MHAFSFTETEAAEYAASMMKKSDQTMRRWRSALIYKDRVLPNWSKGAIYQRSSVLWQNEELRILLLPPRPISVLHQFNLCCLLKNSCVMIQIIIITIIASCFNNDK